MTIQTKTTFRDGYIRITTTGTMVSREEAQAYGDFIFDLAQQRGTKLILLDERGMVDEEDALDAYEVSESETLAEMGMAGFRIALVSAPANLAINRTWETIMQNRSINLRVFSDMESATDWLTS
ncbi:hypothetical protein GM415_04690 [Pseudodesulfovibrio cashew]|uniref:STAS/SEC14 domain-containing protein n=1 Tax=Pseudodesulfovibrio cashew TaxID=2678688 RepID=A0A6I6J9V7_9BACT|nr:hypothetical protein [Pseudodesulfovibrio cashew]QGY39445.1 hypothetical protein GM415_04690 [Pseudodesulfovibrio cashew]